MRISPALFLAALAAVPAATALAADSTVATFTGGQTDGWVGSNGDPSNGAGTFVDTEDGTPAPSLRTQFTDFFLTFSNTSADWTGDYSAAPFTFSVDVNSRLTSVFGTPTDRPLVLELRDFDNVAQGYPFVSVFYTLGIISSDGVNGQAGWQTLSVTVDDPTQAALPAGWGGYGAEDPVTFEPVLPPGRTFADVLSGVDQIALMTIEPGLFSTFVVYDLAIDNPTLQFSPVPEPTTAAGVLLATGLLLGRRRRLSRT